MQPALLSTVLDSQLHVAVQALLRSHEPVAAAPTGPDALQQPADASSQQPAGASSQQPADASFQQTYPKLPDQHEGGAYDDDDDDDDDDDVDDADSILDVDDVDWIEVPHFSLMCTTSVS